MTKQLTTGIIAPVDAGKTTLSEALLYHGGVLKNLGRVDNGDAFLDPDAMEKQRGITIYLHQANFTYQESQITLIDAPGHVDFAAQAEQMLAALDYAILVVSAIDGVQGYTRTLWRLLDRYHVPTFIFINKADAASADLDAVMKALQTTFGEGCRAFSSGPLPTATLEEIALNDERLLDDYMATGTIDEAVIRQLIQQRTLFPCFAGSALKDSGIAEFLAGFDQWTVEPTVQSEFGAKVFKISHDDKGERLTWVKLTGGELKPRQSPVPDQKVNQIRRYNGARYSVTPVLSAGEVGAITGLTSTYPGQGLGVESDSQSPLLAPVLTYAVDPQQEDIAACLAAVQELADEDRQLTVTWQEQLQEIQVQVMGTMQLEVLTQEMHDRFHLDVGFTKGRILYRETITDSVEGVGHFEPLRHYAEVHLQMTPLPLGSGLIYKNQVSTDVLDKNWQHQIMTNMTSKKMLGVLTGSPITDMQLTLVGGRGSIVHSVGGDFREATWRAIRQGLMMLRTQNKVALLEPWYQFELEVDQNLIGRAMTDVQRMHGEAEPPETHGSHAVLKGLAPVSEMQGYAQTVNAYTHGQGRLDCLVAGYRPCHNQAEVVENIGYEPVSDLENTPDSVFCAHGAGYPVAWDQVPAMAHVAYVTKLP
ncbi:GTP-binding protein [Secundilactobacillus kimchicus]|uniref:elongation factor G n=1 Tax=Secundilactobacillus kimchicus TaxID=528209 RepID=UPI001C013BC8|nr:TetM/TetW/TetO/TetS family tetracycline resistance ribosomal protection protein [Secundilactobacillus kimchicus]MBT9671231.1 GTP-binding protein [Secundilactobacillus kimchicus]